MQPDYLVTKPVESSLLTESQTPSNDTEEVTVEDIPNPIGAAPEVGRAGEIGHGGSTGVDGMASSWPAQVRVFVLCPGLMTRSLYFDLLSFSPLLE